MRCPFTRCSLPARETRLGNSEGLRIQGQTKREQPPNWRSINIYWAGRSTGCPASTAHHLFRGCPAAAPSEGSDASEVFPMLLLRKGTFESSAWSKAELGASTTGLGGFVPRLWHLFSQVYARFMLPCLALRSVVVRRSEVLSGICGLGGSWQSSGRSLPLSPHSRCCTGTAKCGNCSFSPAELVSAPAGNTPGQKQVFTPSYRIPWIPSSPCQSHTKILSEGSRDRERGLAGETAGIKFGEIYGVL